MKILFRVDSSTNIGRFHFHRCLHLAQMLKKMGAKITFASCSSAGNSFSRLRDLGIPFVELSDRKFGVEFGVNHESDDSYELIEKLGNERFDWIVVDHYYLGLNWEKSLRKFTKRILVIDDLANRKHHCDLLVDANEFGDKNFRYSNLVEKNTKLLLGKKFLFLPEEVVHDSKNDCAKKRGLNAVLVDYGEVDKTNETKLALEAAIKFPNISFTVLKGEFNAHSYQAFLGKKNIHLIERRRFQSELLFSHDLLFTVGSVGLWEYLPYGIATVATIIEEDQRALVEECEKRALLRISGLSGEVKSKDIVSWCEHFIEMPSLLSVFSRNARDSVDGLGLKRITDYLFLREEV